MSKKTGKQKQQKLLVNVDTTDFWVSGMKFPNPSSGEATLVDRETGEIRDRYGNREFMAGKNGVHNMSVRMMNSGNKLCFSGSSFARVKSQNLYTSGNVLKACVIAVKRAMHVYKIDPPQEVQDKWFAGDINLTRVDLAVNFRMRSEAEVLDVLDQIRWQLKGKNVTTKTAGTSVCWAPRDGKMYSVGFYAKGPQLRRSAQYRHHPERDRLVAEAETILRVEVRLRSGELKDLHRTKASDWGGDAAQIVFRQYMAHMKFLSVTTGTVTDEELAKLPSRLRHVLVVHKSGVNLKRVYKPHTLQRHQKAFRDLGIDLRCPTQREAIITELPKYLSPKKVINTPPKWMIDANLVPTDTVKAVGKMKVRSCKSAKKKSKAVAGNDSSLADTPLKKTGK